MAKTPEIDNRKSLKNLLINGDMGISQRGTIFIAAANGAYTLDRYVNIKNTGAVHTITKDTDVPTFAQSGYLFQSSLRMNLTTPDDTIAAGDVHYIEQRVEGINVVNIAQKPFTLSFWVKSTTTGTRAVAFRNSGFDRSYVAEYVINAPNTWEYKIINVLASPSDGTWNFSSGVGLRVAWILASGSTNNTTAGAWQTGNFTGTPNIVNGVATGCTDFRITGAMLNVGSTALPFRLAGESFAEELKLCQRYLEKSYHLGEFAGSTSGNGASFCFPTDNTRIHAGVIRFKIRKRATPTVVYYGHRGTGAQNTINRYNGDDNLGFTDTTNPSETGISGYFERGVALPSTTTWYGIQWIADAEL